MKLKYISAILLFALLGLSACTSKQNTEVAYREFYQDNWNRFDYVKSNYEVKNIEPLYDVSLMVELTESYPDEYFYFNMSIFYPNEGGYRSKDYRYRVKDVAGKWNVASQNGYYTFTFPVNRELNFSEKGSYEFLLENKSSKFDLQGVHSIRVVCENR